MSSVLKSIPVNEILENQAALRGVDRESREFKELVESVRGKGVLTAIVVRPNPTPGGHPYVLVDGLQRYTAACEAGLTEIPANVKDMTEDEALQIQIVANVQRIDTKPVEYTRGLQRILASNPLLTKKQLAADLGKTEGWLVERLGLTNLSEAVGKAVDNGSVNLSNAYALSKLPSEQQIELLEQAMALTPQEFLPLASKVRDEVRKAKAEGRAPVTQEFIPTEFLRKLLEIKAERDNPEAVTAILARTSLEGRDSKESVFSAGFQSALLWVLNADPISIDKAKEAFEARKAEQQKKKEAAKQERLEARKVKASLDAERIALEHDLTVNQKMTPEDVAAKLAEFDAKHANNAK